MLSEHVLGRNYVKGMTEGIHSVKEGNKEGFAKIYENFSGYIDLLRNHINKENNILFRMADNTLSEADQQELLKQFTKIENSSFCGGVLKEWIADIENLEEHFKQ